MPRHPKSTLRKIEECLGAGIFTSFLIFLAYSEPSSPSGRWPYLPAACGLAMALTIWYALSTFFSHIPRLVFRICLLLPGLVGGAVAYLLSLPTISLGWYLLGGLVTFLIIWFSELRNCSSPSSA
jgi:hypothetical protein